MADRFLRPLKAFSSVQTRFSIDFRVVNSYAPIEIRKENTSRGYVPLATSTVSKVAKSYLMACMEEDSKVE